MNEKIIRAFHSRAKHILRSHPRIRVFMTACLGLVIQASAADRPNIVWIISEDNSKHFLKIFDDSGAETRNIRALGEHGLRFQHAFSCSPVCSVARSTLMTSVFAPRIGTQFHRAIKPVTLPEDWHLFPDLLRKSGYYTTNNSKKDYNFIEVEPMWDESSTTAHWRNRPDPGQPFFHMQSLGQSHESSLHFDRQFMEKSPTRTSPESVAIPPVHPDTPTFRYTYARYHDRIQLIDELVGKLVAELQADGKLEETFIFYFGDHGGVLPGSKGYINERGVHVPLVIRIPGRYKNQVDQELNSNVDGFVSFVDFGPTVLHLAGIEVPSYMDGKPMLGPGISMRDVHSQQTVFSYADRFDEKYEMVRALRMGKFKYVRHFQGYYPDGLQNNYRYQMLAYKEWRSLHRLGKLNSFQSAFFQPKPPESLYDIESDPFETTNLASMPGMQSLLSDLRSRMNDWMLSLPDLSLFPEDLLVREATHNMEGFIKRHRKEFPTLLETANLAVLPFSVAEPALRDAMASSNPYVRYWAWNACVHFGKEAVVLADSAEEFLLDSEPLVRLKAAEFLALLGKSDPRPVIQNILLPHDQSVLNLIALNSVVFLRDSLGMDGWHISPESVRSVNPEVSRRLLYLNSSTSSQ